MVTGGWIRIMFEKSSDQGEGVRYSQPGTGRHEETILNGEIPCFLKFCDGFLFFGKEIGMISPGKLLKRNPFSGPETEEEGL